jgi:SAM-dependent methyltransferase
LHFVVSHEEEKMHSLDVRQIKICKDKGIDINKDSYILDFGCGDGHRVYQLLDSGFNNSFGYNKGNYMGVENPLCLRREEDVRFFRLSDDGTIPFPDSYFDLVISDQVFEHVIEQEDAFREIHRVLKTNGVSIHVIPAKWQIIEQHILVPFGGLIKSYPYYYFWALLGIRTKWQLGLSAREAARRNIKYARESLNYLSCRQYQRLMSRIPFTHSWEDLAYMKASYRPRVQKMAVISEKCPLVLPCIRLFVQRVLFLQKISEGFSPNVDCLRVQRESRTASARLWTKLWGHWNQACRQVAKLTFQFLVDRRIVPIESRTL